MILPDVNLLIHAVDETSPFHERARYWWDGALSSPLPVGLCLPSLLGFLRITTNRRVVRSPLRIGEAVDLVNGWLDLPQTTLLRPTAKHWRILAALLRETGVGGDLTTDAHLTAYAIEHRCVLCSNDRDFGRFPALHWKNPLSTDGRRREAAGA